MFISTQFKSTNVDGAPAVCQTLLHSTPPGPRLQPTRAPFLVVSLSLPFALEGPGPAPPVNSGADHTWEDESYPSPSFPRWDWPGGGQGQ